MPELTAARIAANFGRKAEVRAELKAAKALAVKAASAAADLETLIGKLDWVSEVIAKIPVHIEQNPTNYDISTVIGPYRAGRAYQSVRAGEGWHVNLLDHVRYRLSGNGNKTVMGGWTRAEAVAIVRDFVIKGLEPTRP
jgi:hypothetical protein